MASTFTIDDPDLQHLLTWCQDGVVARRQLLALGATPNDIRRLLRRRELTARHPGVYTAHSGPLSRVQREWEAVLALWPAALAFESALPDHPGLAVQVAVIPGRTVEPPDGVLVRRMTRLHNRVNWRAAPPQVHVEHATIDTMERHLRRGDVAAAFTTLSKVLFSRRTTVADLEATLAARGRVAGRRTLAALLADARTGACSVLERGYLHRVERAHGLPRGSRQRRSSATGDLTFQDVRYDAFGLIVEPDGRAYHDTATARDKDARRDLAELATTDDATARVTYGMVFDDPCRTAGWIAQVLRRRGWLGRPVACSRCPGGQPPA